MGFIWRFSLNAFVRHLEECLPPTLTIRSVECVRQPHVSNYNLFVPQTDAVAILIKEPCTVRDKIVQLIASSHE